MSFVGRPILAAAAFQAASRLKSRLRAELPAPQVALGLVFITIRGPQAHPGRPVGPPHDLCNHCTGAVVSSAAGQGSASSVRHRSPYPGTRNIPQLRESRVKLELPHARRVFDCGGARHLLLRRQVARELEREWLRSEQRAPARQVGYRRGDRRQAIAMAAEPAPIFSS